MFKLEESMSREGKLGNSYLQKLLRGLDQTFIPVEQKFFFSSSSSKTKKLKVKSLANEGNPVCSRG